MGTTFEAFEGAVIFHMTPRQTIRFSITMDELFKAFPEFLDTRTGADGRQLTNFKTGTAAGQLAMFMWSFGFTKDISFNLKPESDPALVEFQEWWRKNSRPTDWRRLFEDYQVAATDELVNIWYDAYTQTRPPEAVAPEELQDGAEIIAAGNPDFLEPGKPALKISGGKSKRTPEKVSISS